MPIYITALMEQKFYNKGCGRKGKYNRAIIISVDRGSKDTTGVRNFDKYPYFKYFNVQNPNVDHDPQYRIAMVEPKFVIHYEGKQDWKEGFNDDDKVLLMENLYSKNTDPKLEGDTVWDAMRNYVIRVCGADPEIIPLTPPDYTKLPSKGR